MRVCLCVCACLCARTHAYHVASVPVKPEFECETLTTSREGKSQLVKH